MRYWEWSLHHGKKSNQGIKSEFNDTNPELLMQSSNIFLKEACHVSPLTITSGISSLSTTYCKNLDKTIQLFKPVNKLSWKVHFLFMNNTQFHSWMLQLKGAILLLSSLPTPSYIFMPFSQHLVHLYGQPRLPTADDQPKTPPRRFSAGVNFRSSHLYLALRLLATFSTEHI